MSVHEHRETSPEDVAFCIATVSDTRTPENDTSGDVIASMLKEAGYRLAERSIVRDEPAQILSALKRFMEGEAKAMVFSGGTGITSRDVTYETIAPLVDKMIVGFGEIFRFLSYRDIGSAAVMSRAFAGVVGKKIVFCLPGSPEAARLAVGSIIIPEIRHIVREVSR